MSLDSFTPAEMQHAIAGDDWESRAIFRAATRRSLYVFVKAVTCYNEIPNLLDPSVFKESCDWLQYVVTTTKRGLYEDPRGHVKSTRSTDSIPNWIAILRPDEAYDFPEEIERAEAFLVAHPHLRAVDSRIVVASHAKTRATVFTATGKRHWELNPVLRWAYPEKVWANPNVRDSGRWSDEAWTPNGRVNKLIRDDFVRSVGLESSEEGGRAEGILVDDLVGETNFRSETEMARCKDWLKNIGNLLENADPRAPGGGFVLVIENRWSLNDVNTMIHSEFSHWDVWRRSCYRCVVHGVGNCGRWTAEEDTDCADSDVPLWIDRYPDAESLERVRRDKGDEIFDAQWRNDPTKSAALDASKFRPFFLDVATWVDTTTGERTRGWSVVIPDAVDTLKPSEVIPLRQLAGHVISMDPASSRDSKAARTAVSWLAIDRPTGRVFWLDCVGERMDTDAAVETVYAMWLAAAEKLGVEPAILVEKVAAQAYVASALRFLHGREARTRGSVTARGGFRLPEVEMEPPAHGEAKNDRIMRRTGWRLGQGLLYLRSGLQLPRAEVRHFPTGTKDALDTEAQAEVKFQELQGRGADPAAIAMRRRRRRARIAAAGAAGVLP